MGEKNYESMTVEEIEQEILSLNAAREAIREEVRRLWKIHGEKVAAAKVAALESQLPAGHAIVKVGALGLKSDVKPVG